MAKKLNINNDDMISLEELNSRQDKRFQMLNLNADGMIDRTEFNSHIVAMFEKMDSNGDGSLDDNEIREIKRHNYGTMYHITGGYSNSPAVTGLCPSPTPIRRSQNPVTPN